TTPCPATLAGMLDKVITGGQTGAGQGALRAARAAGIPTGGWAPLGWLVETADGRKTEAAPWLAELGLVEGPGPGFKARSVANVRDSDGSLWFGDWHTAGGTATLDACRLLGRPFLISVRTGQEHQTLQANGQGSPQRLKVPPAAEACGAGACSAP